VYPIKYDAQDTCNFEATVGWPKQRAKAIDLLPSLGFYRSRCQLMLRGLPVLVLLAGCVRLGFGVEGLDGGSGGALDGRGEEPSLDGTVDLSDRDLSPDDLSQPDLLPDGSPWPAYTFVSFKGLWNLPHTLAWGWQCSSEPANFSHYELCYAKSLQALGASPTCLTPSDDETLAMVACAGGFHQGMTYDLTPSTVYYARVRACNTAKVCVTSPVAQQSTGALPATKVVLFSESLPTGGVLQGFAVSSTKPAAGQNHLEATVTNNNWTDLRVRQLPLSFSGMTQARFDAAYVEVYVDLPRAREVWALFDAGTDFLKYVPPQGYLTVNQSAGYQRIQFPLNRLVWQKGGKLVYTDVSKITGIDFACYYLPGMVYFDEISIFY
jgi:hypothetical protein